MSSQLFNYMVSGTGQTTDAATITTIASLDTTGIGDTGIAVEGELIGFSTGNAATSAKGRRTFKIVAGTLSALGTLAIPDLFDGDLASTSVMTIDASSPTLRLRVNGIAATTINWIGWLRLVTTPY